ncbi:MAG TPA: hypothetical protein VFG50_02245 [Rhodothermales bacterium]|nr:hypothetical protein [Rhodothermales bacterium]
MGLDIRLPIGLLFTIFGIMLTLFGAFTTGSPIYVHSLGINVNVIWGICILIFGVVFLYLGRRGTSAMEPAALTPEGRATEEREVATGLESESPIVRDLKSDKRNEA